MPYFDFQPDLIVECTRVCDRGCKGCYAPNVVLRDRPSAMTGRLHDLHLSAADLSTALASLLEDEGPDLVSAAIRGGEPSLHPQLETLLAILSERACPVYLETHGRWIGLRDGHLLEACRAYGVFLKISFDDMHEITADELSRICAVASRNDVRWLVAITARTIAEFERTRRQCAWIPDDRIVRQRKAHRARDLVSPRLGVLKPNGALDNRLSVMSAFPR